MKEAMPPELVERLKEKILAEEPSLWHIEGLANNWKEFEVSCRQQ